MDLNSHHKGKYLEEENLARKEATSIRMLSVSLRRSCRKDMRAQEVEDSW